MWAPKQVIAKVWLNDKKYMNVRDFGFKSFIYSKKVGDPKLKWVINILDFYI